MSSFVYNLGSYEPPSFSEHIEEEFGLFFDGTGNNRLNVDARKLVRLQPYFAPEQTLEFLDDKLLSQITNFKTEKQEKFSFAVPNISREKNKPIQQESKKSAIAINPQAKKEYERLNKTYNRDERNNLREAYHKYAEAENSYENDHSNVARMWLKSENKYYGIYVEGIGTTDSNSDTSFPGVTYGSGATGIVAKVQKGSKLLVHRLLDKYKDLAFSKADEKYKNKNPYKSISLTLDVFGFSRGAAAARHFVYATTYRKHLNEDCYVTNSLVPITQEENKSYLELELLNRGVPENLVKSINITIRFVGIYDTVASYSPNSLFPHFESSIKKLKLNQIEKSKCVVHFTALDEVRKNFALSRIPSGNNFIEKALPGVHSDIGGGYDCDGIDITENRLLDNKAQGYKKQQEKKAYFINEGWYTNEQISCHYPDFDVVGIRKNLLGIYSYLPLKWMGLYASFFIDESKIEYDKIHQSYDYKIFSELKDTLKKTEEYIGQNSLKSLFDALMIKDEYGRRDKSILFKTNDVKNIIWELNGQNDELLKELRNKLLHQSAHYKKTFFVITPHKPNEINNEPSSNRKRTIL